MLRRRVPFTQLAMATLLGVAGGVYIYRPFFEPELKTQEKTQHKEVNKEKEPEP